MSKTLDEIFQQFGHYCFEEGRRIANNNPNPPQEGLQQSDAKQAILQWVNDEVVGSQDKKEYWPVWKQELLERQRAILKQHGWKEQV